MQRLWILIAAVALIGTASLFWLATGTSRPAYAAHIPAEASSVILLDVGKVATTLVTAGFSDREYLMGIAEKLKRKLPVSGTSPGAGEIPGLSLTGRAAFFTYSDTAADSDLWGICMGLSDSQVWERFVRSSAKSNAGEVMITDGEYPILSAPDKSIALTWNRNFVILAGGADTGVLIRLLEKQVALPAKSVSPPVFAPVFEKNADITGWLDFKRLPKDKTSSVLWKALFQHGIVSADFSKNEISIEWVLSPQPKYQKAFARTSNQVGKAPESSPAPIRGIANLSPDFLQQIVEDPALEKEIKENRRKEIRDILTWWDGSASYNIHDFRKIEQEYISYDFDEDFNKVEVIKKRNVSVPEMEVVLGCHTPAQLNAWLTSREQQNVLIRGTEYHKLIRVLDFDVFLRQFPDHLRIGTDSTLFENKSEKTFTEKEKQALFQVSVQFDQLPQGALPNNTGRAAIPSKLEKELEQISFSADNYEKQTLSGSGRLVLSKSPHNILLRIINSALDYFP